MKIVKFLGGLGNQMFQYAFYLSLKQHFKNVKADLSDFDNYPLHNGFELEDVFNLKVIRAANLDLRMLRDDKRDWISRRLKKMAGTKNACYQESQLFGFDPTIYSDPTSRYYWGYWQNINYFQGIEWHLKEIFTFKNPLTAANFRLAERIQSSNSVSVHIRRGDYLNDPLLGGICDLQYYQKAIKQIDQTVNNPFFVVFSNDIEWCKKSLSLQSAEYVDWNTGINSHRDMQLMSLCKHHIIANSSFSWWAAWLNSSPEKIVIAPDKWANMDMDYSGIILSDWKTV